jgi:hypothetical protein
MASLNDPLSESAAAMTHIPVTNASAEPTRAYWLSGPVGLIAKGLTGCIAVLLAVKTINGAPTDALVWQDHLFRVIAFAGLTVWAALTIGLHRRGAAAIIVLGFASAVEWFVLPTRGATMGTLVSANLGIVLAYCGLHLYWNSLTERAKPPAA